MLPFALAAVLAAPGSDSLPIVSTRVVPSLRPLAMAAAPTGRRVVLTLEDRRTVVIDAATRQVAMTLDSHPLPARAVAWSPDGRWIATGDESARVFLFDAKTGKRVRTIREHQRAIQALSFSPKGDLLASTGADDAVFVFSTETGKKVGTILGKGANVYGGCFTPSGSLLVGTLSNGVMLYLANGQPVAQLGGHPGQGAFGCFPNKAGTLGVSAGRDGIASLWDLRKRTRINSLRGHQDWVTAAAFAPVAERGGRVHERVAGDDEVEIEHGGGVRSLGRVPRHQLHRRHGAVLEPEELPSDRRVGEPGAGRLSPRLFRRRCLPADGVRPGLPPGHPAALRPEP